MLRRSRITMLSIGIVVLLIALTIKPNIFKITYFVGTLFASAWAAAALMGIYSRKITEAAAFWSIVTGFVLNVGLRAMTELGWILLPVWASPLILGAVGSLVVAVTLSRFSAPTKAALAFRKSLRQVPTIECDASEVRKSLHACKILAIYGVVAATALLWFYVRPLQLATGEASGDSLSLIGAESLSAIAYGLLLVITAWAIYRKTRATYSIDT